MDRLRTLCEVAEAGGIAKAAPGDPDRQSLYSRQIKELKGVFGTELLRRKGRGVELTPEGDRLARASRDYFRALEDIVARTRQQQVEFHVAAANSILEWIVIPRLARVASELPQVRFRFSDLRSQEIATALRDHRADFGIVRANVVAHPFKSQRVGCAGYRMFAPAGTPETRPKPLALAGGAEFREQIGRLAADAGVRLHVGFHCQSFAQCAVLVRQGAAMAVLPDYAAPFVPDLASFQPAWLAPYQREIRLVWRDGLEDVRPLAREAAAALLGRKPPR